MGADDVAALHEAAEAALEDDDAEGAAQALRAVLRMDPDDVDALVALGHLDHRAGRDAEAVDRLARAALARPDDVGVLRHLLALHRAAGHHRDAAACAEQLVALRPADALALLDLAELQLALGEHAGARAAFARLRDVLVGTGRAIVAVHGMVEAELAAGHPRAALDLAVEATGLDRTPLTTELLELLVATVLGAGAPDDRPPPDLPAVLAALAAERRSHRARLELADEGTVG